MAGKVFVHAGMSLDGLCVERTAVRAYPPAHNLPPAARPPDRVAVQPGVVYSSARDER
jgi:hypothetical protein